MRLALACVLVALLVAATTAAPGTYFTSQDEADFTTLLNGELKQGEFGSVFNNLAAVESLVLLNKPIKDTAKLCESANKGTNALFVAWNPVEAHKIALIALTVFHLLKSPISELPLLYYAAISSLYHVSYLF